MTAIGTPQEKEMDSNEQYGITLEERNLALDFLSFGVLFGASESVGIDDQGTLFALSDMRV